MTVSLCAALAGCACGMLFGVSTARAAGGRLQFSGAILEPTCGIATEIAVQMVAETAASETRRLACAGPGNVMTTAPRIYELAVVRLSSAVQDRVLKYFDAYVKQGRADAADPMLVIQTYE